jgi:hypothetical protein
MRLRETTGRDDELADPGGELGADRIARLLSQAPAIGGTIPLVSTTIIIS